MTHGVFASDSQIFAATNTANYTAKTTRPFVEGASELNILASKIPKLRIWRVLTRDEGICQVSPTWNQMLVAHV